MQHGLGDGPCVAAARDGATVVSGSLGDEARWGTFGAQVAALGVHGVVSLPLKQGADVLGAVDVQHAHVLERARRVAAELRAGSGSARSSSRRSGSGSVATGSTPTRTVPYGRHVAEARRGGTTGR